MVATFCKIESILFVREYDFDLLLSFLEHLNFAILSHDCTTVYISLF
jgi:hypothetical protein